MTPNNSDSKQLRFGSSEQSPAKDRMLANHDPGVSRREFLGMTGASLLIAGRLSDAAKPDSKNGIPHRTVGHTGESVSLVGLGGYHLGMEQTAGGARNDGIVRNESKDGQVYEHPAPHGYADISRSRGLGPGYFVAGTTAGASAESRCCPYASCCEREWPGCLRF